METKNDPKLKKKKLHEPKKEKYKGKRKINTVQKITEENWRLKKEKKKSQRKITRYKELQKKSGGWRKRRRKITEESRRLKKTKKKSWEEKSHYEKLQKKIKCQGKRRKKNWGASQNTNQRKKERNTKSLGELKKKKINAGNQRLKKGKKKIKVRYRIYHIYVN